MRWVPLLAMLVLPALLHAAEEAEDLLGIYGSEEVVSIATGRAQLVAKAPAVASVITSEQLERMGARTLGEALESVPGLHVSLSSIRLSPIYSIRGIHTDKNPQVLMLLNGIPMTNVFFGDRGARSEMPIHFIEKVEVIRGPGSAVYGADAFAGVINVITKTASDISGMEFGARAGSFETYEGWVTHGRRYGDIDLAFGVEVNTTEGDRDRLVQADALGISDAQSIFDEVIGTSASLAPGPLETGKDRLDTRLNLVGSDWRVNWYSRHLRNAGHGPGVAQALDATGDNETDDLIIDGLYWDAPSVNWDMEYRAYFSHVDSKATQVLFPPSAVLPIGPDGNVNPFSSNLVLFTDGLIGNPGVEESKVGVDVAAFYQGVADHRFRFAAGAEYVEAEGDEQKNFGPGVIDGTESPVDGTLTDVTGTSDAFFVEEGRRILWASVQDEISLAANWDLTVGLRVDDYSDFGTTANPRLAVVWETSPSVTTKFLYGRAFRAPSFAELYLQNNPVTLGNSDLDPEIINTAEVAVSIRPRNRLTLGVNVFVYRVEDLISFVPGPGGTRAENVGEFDGRGFEVEARVQATERFGLSGHLAYQDTEDRDTGEPVPNAPRKQAYLQADYRFFEDWMVDGRATFIGDRPRAVGDPRPEIDDYTLVDLTLRRDAGQGLFFGLGIKNLFDEEAFEPSPFESSAPTGSLVPLDYRLEGRYLFGEIGYKF